ncbi:MAG: TIM-barrel domain-containing protein, partial [Bacteroidota bacterium]
MAKQQKKKTSSKAKPTPKPYAPAAHLIQDTKTATTERYSDVFTVHTIGQVSAITTTDDQSFTVVSNGTANLRIEVWNDRTVRFRTTVGPAGRDFSYARAEDAKPTFAKTALKEGRSVYTITTDLLKIEIAKATGKVTVSDKKSKAKLHEYATEFSARTTLLNGLEQVRIQLKTDKDEAIYGMGDKGWDTNLQGTYWANYNEDAFAFSKDRKTNYRSIPFYYGLRDGKAYGLFLDNTYRSHFDFNSTGDNLTTVWADGGEMDYYFFFGPDLSTVAAEYHNLTGKPELPPLWAMGFHQCRWSYYPESRVRELAATFRAKKIPCDAIYLDIDYMDGYRCFTWNKEHFPDPKGMIADLKEDGFHTVVMIDPGIRVDPDYHVYADGSEKGVWCKR